MPSLIKVRVRALEDLIYSIPMSGRYAQRLVLDSLGQMAEAVRRLSANGTPPYSVGQILAPKESLSEDPRYASLRQDEEALFFIGVCWDELKELMLKEVRGVRELAGAKVELTPELIREERYRDLLNGIARKVSLKTRNRLILGSVKVFDQAFPRYDPWRHNLNPQQIFATPFNVWNAFSPIKFPRSVFNALSRVEVLKAKFRTRMALIPYGGKLEGTPSLEGEIHLSLGGLDADTGVKALALLKLAEYSGIGVKTTQGFGSVSLKVLEG